MPCRICTANDEEALVDDLARAVWDACREPEAYDEWDAVGPFWQGRMRRHVETMLRTARQAAAL